MGGDFSRNRTIFIAEAIMTSLKSVLAVPEAESQLNRDGLIGIGLGNS